MKPGKLDELRCSIQAISNIVHVIILTETWIKSESEAQKLTLPNYTHYFNYRSNKRGGGVSIYVHNNLKHEASEELYENDNHYLWIHIDKFNLNIGAIYKPERTNNDSFLETFSQQLLKRQRVIVFGDFN